MVSGNPNLHRHPIHPINSFSLVAYIAIFLQSVPVEIYPNREHLKMVGGMAELAKSIVNGIGIGFLSCIGIGIGIVKTIFKVLVLVLVLLRGFPKVLAII